MDERGVSIKLGGAWLAAHEHTKRLQETVAGLNGELCLEKDRVAELEKERRELQAALNTANRSAERLQTEVQQTTDHLALTRAQKVAAESALARAQAATQQEQVRARGLEEERDRLLHERALVSQDNSSLQERLTVALEEGERLCELLYKSQEEGGALQGRLEQEQERSAGLVRVKEQKEHHICLLVREKERLHRRLADVRNRMQTATTGAARRAAVEIGRSPSPPRPRVSVARPPAPPASASASASASSEPQEAPKLLLAQIRKLRAALERKDKEAEAMAAEKEALKRRNDELLQRFRGATRARALAERKKPAASVAGGPAEENNVWAQQ